MHEARLQRVLERLRQDGILLMSDPRLPNAVYTIAGAKVKGSWWGSKKKFEIFGTLRALESHPSIVVTRLVSGKVTFVHRGIWSEFLAVATSGEEWQKRSLSAEGLRLLKLVRTKSSLRTDEIPWRRNSKIGDVARELEKRLLIFTKEVHTERGSHAKILRTWKDWAKKAKYQPTRVDVAEAKAWFEAILSEMNLKYGAEGTLPWR